MINVSVQVDIDRITNKLRASARQSEQAASRALNRTAARVRTYAAREIRTAGYNIKANAIKRNISIQRANPGLLVAVVRAVGKPIPLIDYGARASKRSGVTVSVKNGRHVLRHAFIAVMPNGHRGVFQRIGAARERVSGIVARRIRGSGDKRAGRLPIAEMFGPGVPQAFANSVVQRNLEANARSYFPTEMTRQLLHILNTT